MSFTELFIRRPVLAIVVSLLIFLMGAQGLMNLAVRQYPEVKETTVTITTAYPGASASLMQGFITTPIARAVSAAEGVDYVTSKSRLGVSTVSVRMRLNVDPNAALTEVSARVQQVRAQLPTDAEDPVILKGTGQSFALMYLTFGSKDMTAEQVTEFLTRVVQPRLATLEGVGAADILGGRDFSMRVWIDPIRLAARNVTASDVVGAIRANNFLSTPGKTQNEFVAYSLEMQTTLQTAETFGALPVASRGDGIVRLRDVAKVELGPKSTDTLVSFDGQEGTFIGITPAPSANPLSVARLVEEAMKEIQATLPQGMVGFIVYDASDFISASIWEVFKTIGEATIIVILVILLFLGSFRAVMIPVVTIPLSLVGVCFVLYSLGYSINLLTLLAMVLAIGLVVDDAIVVVENIHRHIEEGLTPIEAAVVGMKEIFRPIVSMTITLAAVYAPIGFTQGLTGTLFREFAFTLAGSVIISGIVAVTLSPMMASRFLATQGHGSRFAQFVDRNFGRFEDWYSRRLHGALDYRRLIIFMAVGMLATTALLFSKTSSELAPEEDQGFFMGILNTPQYATAEYTNAFAVKLAQAKDKISEITNNFLIIGIDGGGGGFFGFKLKEWSERADKKAAASKQEIQNYLNDIAGFQAFAFAPPSLPGASDGLPIQYVIRSIGEASQVFEVAEEIKNKAQASGRFIVVQNSMTYTTPRARIVIDRDRAASLGVQISDIGNTVSALVGGTPISKFDRDNRSYDVISQVPRRDRFNPEELSQYYVRAANGGGMVPLSALVRIDTDASPAVIEQFNQLNSATISALPLPGTTTSTGLQTLREVSQQVLPSGFYVDYAGQSRLEVKEGSSIAIAFALAIIVIYLVLAAQFESFRDPFIIMVAVPLSMFGAIAFLNLGFATLNIYTQVGLITLIGLITKHGILMVEFANDLRDAEGVDRREAIERAARTRLRPILMTTAAMVLGVVPLITATGAGAAARFSMGLVIATGMAIGTVFTLFMVPTFYTFISKEHRAKAVSGTGGGHAVPAE